MIGVMALFFGVIITANLTLAYFAGMSWSGLIAKNGYVASQEFNAREARLREQQRRGWKGDLSWRQQHLTFTLANRHGDAVHAASIIAHVQRPTHERDDQTIALQPDGRGGYTAPLRLDPGDWIVAIEAVSLHGHLYKKVFRFNARDEM